MKKECSIGQARLLYEDGQLSPALEMCEALLREGTDQAEAARLAAAAAVLMGCPEKDSKKQERIRSCTARACEWTEDRLGLEQELLEQMCSYEERFLTNTLGRLKEQAGIVELKGYFATAEKYEQVPALVREKTRAGEAHPESSGDAPEKQLRTRLARMEYDTSRSVFSEVKMRVQFHGTGPTKTVSETMKTGIEMLTVAQLLAVRCNFAPCDAQTRLQRLESEAEILHYALSCVLHPDGQVISLFCSGRQELREKLEQLYGEIREENPRFHAPELPPLEAVNTVPRKQEKKSLFGRRKKKK